MSREAVEAVFRYSHTNRIALALIASKNQIDYTSGYVNGWTTGTFMLDVAILRQLYADADITIARDHCGPGFNGIHDMEDTYNTIHTDIEAGFDMIHFDFCHMATSLSRRLKATAKAIETALAQKPDLKIEIGTDENAIDLKPFDDVTREVSYFKERIPVDFYVVKTGSLVMEDRQIGTFNPEYVSKVYRYLDKLNIKLKEHNADYLTENQIRQRRSSVHCMNVAPQLGVVQTDVVHKLCLHYGIDPTTWLNIAWNSNHWRKWVISPMQPDRFWASRLAGHYTFNSDEYKRVISKLEKKMRIHPTEFITQQIGEVIDTYVQNRN